jgi:hypothetical protein
MDFSKSQLVILFVLTALLSTVGVAQENAVAGQVRLKKSEKPLGDVRVELAQMPNIHCTTDARDGVYVLPVPKSLKQFDLIYEHDNCFKANDEGILNEQAQNKRPVRELIPRSVAAIKDLSNEELTAIVNSANKMRVRGLLNNLPILASAGESNLSDLANAANKISREAEAHITQGRTAEADVAYKTAINILEKTKPQSFELAGLHDNYASLLRKMNRDELAKQQSTKADEIRLQAERRNRVYLVANNLGSAEYVGQIWSEESDKFATDHANELPDLQGTVTVLSDAARQFGRISVPGRGSATFQVYVEKHFTAYLRILRSEEVQYDIAISDDKGKVKLESFHNAFLWDAVSKKTFTVTVSNNDPQKRDYVVHLGSFISPGRPNQP